MRALLTETPATSACGVFHTSPDLSHLKQWFLEQRCFCPLYHFSVAAITHPHTLGSLTNKHLLPTVQKVGTSQIKVSADLVHGENPLPGL